MIEANVNCQPKKIAASVNIHIRQVFSHRGIGCDRQGGSWETDPVKTADGMISPKKSTTVTWGWPNGDPMDICYYLLLFMLELHALEDIQETFWNCCDRFFFVNKY